MKQTWCVSRVASLLRPQHMLRRRFCYKELNKVFNRVQFEAVETKTIFLTLGKSYMAVVGKFSATVFDIMYTWTLFRHTDMKNW